ncbi:MAG: hypothetical protein ABI665_15495 [Vicinamibacterales bacterium]
MKHQPGPYSAAAAYALLSLVLTWPLAPGLWRDVPGDLGDSLLNMWILAWGADHIPRLLVGAISWQDFWNANIFHPDPLALTFSEHLFGQALQILPVYWITGNAILCYNLIFLSTFALSGLGTYLLVRDLTGNRWAAFFAGLIYGFLPYRIASVPHVQVMSSQWMPFALYGLNRYITSGSYRALVGGTAALVMQNWSCGYYLLYFAPFAPLFVVYRMWITGRLRDLRVWIAMTGAATVTVLLTIPFLLPYLDAQRRFGFQRPFGEVVLFSANVWSYITAAEPVRMWGRILRYYPHGEGETFLGFVPALLALVALIAVVRAAIAETGNPKGLPPQAGAETGNPEGLPPQAGGGKPSGLPGGLPGGWPRRILTAILIFAVVTQFIAVASAVIFGGFDTSVFGIALRARTPQRLLWQLALAVGLLLVVAPRSRGVAARLARAPAVFFLALTVLAMWFSLGPEPKAGTQFVSGFGLYGVLYDYVPGFRGVRVPARYAMIAGLFLAVVAGFGAAELIKWKRKAGLAILALAGVLALAEGAAIPMTINHAWSVNEAMPPSRVFPASGAPPVYARVKSLPAGTALTEFPFGDAAWEIRYVYYSTAHWKPITNGYSGSFPPGYKVRQARLQNVTKDPDASWQSLIDSGSTHAVVHRQAFAKPEDAATIEAWLTAHNASVIETFADGDVLYAIR